jgi:hypothetical protein
MMMILVISRVAVMGMEPQGSDIAVRMTMDVQGRAPAKLDRHDEHEKDREQAMHDCHSTRLLLSAKCQVM